MAAFEPFEANSSATAGKTVTLLTAASNTSTSVVVSITAQTPSVLLTNFGPNFAWVRMSGEASPSATSADIPMLGNTSRLFANPVGLGNLGVAVIVSVTTSPNILYITPGQGGTTV